MKKVYTKPQIEFESFTLCSNIAAGCEYKTYTYTLNSCSYTYNDEFFGPINLFVDGVCSDPQADGYNGFCYHVPTASSNIFNS